MNLEEKSAATMVSEIITLEAQMARNTLRIKMLTEIVADIQNQNSELAIAIAARREQIEKRNRNHGN